MRCAEKNRKRFRNRAHIHEREVDGRRLFGRDVGAFGSTARGVCGNGEELAPLQAYLVGEVERSEGFGVVVEARSDRNGRDAGRIELEKSHTRGENRSSKTMGSVALPPRLFG